MVLWLQLRWAMYFNSTKRWVMWMKLLTDLSNEIERKICRIIVEWISNIVTNPLSANFIKWSNTLKQFVGNLPTNCLSVFDHVVGLALKGLITKINITFLFSKYVFHTSSFFSYKIRKATKNFSRSFRIFNQWSCQRWTNARDTREIVWKLLKFVFA